MENNELANRRSDPRYDRVQYRRAVKMLFYSMILSLCLMLLQAYRLFTFPGEATYVTTTVGSLHTIVGSEKPDFSGVIKDVR